MAVFEYRMGRSDIFRRTRRRVDDLADELEDQRETLAHHSEQISGDGGIQKTLKAARDEFRDELSKIRAEMREEVGSLRRAFYGLAGSIIVATLGLLGAIISHAI